MHRSLVLLALLLGIFLIGPMPLALAQLPLPELTALRQLGYQIGQPWTPIDQALGNHLNNAKPWFSNPSFSTEQVPAGTQPGFVQVRARNDTGLSNSRNLMITAEPWQVVVGNESPTTATTLTPGTFWQDECPERGRNFYRIQSDQDQVLHVQSFAYALDSRARLILSLQDPNGATIANFIATNDLDATLHTPIRANQSYTLVVHDNIFRGGPEYRYALKMTTSASTTDNHSPILERWTNAASQLDRIRNDPTQNVPDSSCWSPRAALLRSPIALSNPQVHNESEFADPKAMIVTWPAIVVGSFESPTDWDAFDIECEANTDVVAEIVSQRLGEPSDSAMTVYRVENPDTPNQKLHRLADNDDMPAGGNGEIRFVIKDSLIAFRSSEKGRYRIVVRDQEASIRRPNAPAFALEIRSPQPGLVLAANLSYLVRDLDQARMSSGTLPIGGATMLSVHAMRYDGLSGPIELQASGLPPDVHGTTGLMEPEQRIATLNLWHDPSWPEQSASDLVSLMKVVGTIKTGDQSLSAIAAPLEVKWNAIDTFRAPQSRLAQSLAVVKSGTITCPNSIELGPKAEPAVDLVTMEAIRGQPLKIPVRVTRRIGGEGPIVLRVHHTAPKTSAGEIRLEANVVEGTLDLQIPKDAPIGDFLVGGLGEVTVSLPNPDVNAAEKTIKYNLQLPTSNIRLRIGDAPATP